MDRIQLVEKTLERLYRQQKKGITASEIANEINFDRSNISRDLNQLVRENKCKKVKSRPVLFLPVHSNQVKEMKAIPKNKDNFMIKTTTDLETFSTVNPSLFHQIEQGKAAILYPPNGMHTLILGETGVGKTMFAELLYHYAIEIGRLAKSSSFIHFNCADYANNPQLLMGHLFGRVKGAYTGADTNQKGLLKQAHGGILFLDEVHRLPIEGQEMLFSFIDKGTFKPLGETEKEEHSDAMLIAATTEDSKHLLPTFIRRIPMIITLPNLNDRTLEERFQLLNFFLKKEVSKLGMQLQMTVNATKAFLSYSCENNIGQFKADIKIACAKAYSNFLTGKEDALRITTANLPENIKEGLFAQTEHRKLWAVFSQINERFFTYEPTDNDAEVVDNSLNVYHIINQRYRELEEENLSVEAIQQAMEEDLRQYFTKAWKQSEQNKQPIHLNSIIPENLQKIIQEMIGFSEEKLQRKLSTKIVQAFSIHVYNLVERIKNRHPIENPELAHIRKIYPDLFQIATESLLILANYLQVEIPKDEAGYLVLFFTYDGLADIKKHTTVQVIVIAHGDHTATALSQTVNTLLGNKNVIGINAHLDEKPESVLKRLKYDIAEKGGQQDVLLLVDMGSLMTFASELIDEFEINAKAIPLVSTMHVIEASRKAMLGYSLEEVFEETLRVNDYLGYAFKHTSEKVSLSNSKGQKPLAILSVCLTGEGTALTIQQILTQELQLNRKEIKLIPLNIVGKETIQMKIEAIQKEYRVICIVSSFHIQTAIKQIDLYQVINGVGLELIAQQIDEEIAYKNIESTISKYYDLPNLQEIIARIYVFNDTIEELLNTKFLISSLIGLSFHIIGMILKDHRKEVISPFADAEGILEVNPTHTMRIQETFKQQFSPYFHSITNDHLNYVAYSYLKK
ncbi:sigma-54-dependent transcriptional regulator [Enterococcus sp. LJL99]